MGAVKTVRVDRGWLHLSRSTVWCDWDHAGRETWRLPDNEWGRQQARENFESMRERWTEKGEIE